MNISFHFVPFHSVPLEFDFMFVDCRYAVAACVTCYIPKYVLYYYYYYCPQKYININYNNNSDNNNKKKNLKLMFNRMYTEIKLIFL